MLRTLVALTLVSGCVSWTARADEHAAWGYSSPTGPANWKDISKDYAVCGVGKHQSPIDIRTAVTSQLPALQFHYAASALRVIDNGHTIQVNYLAGSTLTVGGESYELKQIHFHEPSEERVQGRGFAMVAHLVHQNSRGELTVIAVLLTEGRPNAFLASVWKNLPAEKNLEKEVTGISVNVTDLLPQSRGYYTYSGSLTTPPCSEDVTWFVLKTPVEVSAEQIAEFGRRYRDNARPVQPLNARTVRETPD